MKGKREKYNERRYFAVHSPLPPEQHPDPTPTSKRPVHHPVQMTSTPAHLDGCAALEKLCFHEPWSAHSLELLCNDGIGVAYLCEETTAEGTQITAYGGMLITVDEGQITNIAVHPDHRRQGLGRAILRALLKHAKTAHLSSVTLEVRPSNTAAIALYKKNGFTEIGRRKAFYSKPTEDALIMEARLK